VRGADAEGVCRGTGGNLTEENLGANMMDDAELRREILEFINYIKEVIEDEKAKGAISPELEMFNHLTVTNFEYGDNGINIGQSGSFITKPTWSSASRKIIEIIGKTEKYKSLADIIKTKQEGTGFRPLFEGFVLTIIPLFLENRDIGKEKISELLDNFLLELKNKPLKSGAIVQLEGLILHQDMIEISHGISIRKPRKEDFERDIPYYTFYNIHDNFPRATAFLEISIVTVYPIEVQDTINRTITVLRLFKPGSVKYISYNLHSDAIARMFFGTMSSGVSFPALEKYVVNEEDISRLKNFHDRILPYLPQNLYKSDGGREDHISIAYSLYSEALLQGGIIERRIANAIMGLEAIYFKPSGEQQELIYRLSIRVAKVLDNFSCNPSQTRGTLKDAYSVRSIFSHGGRLDYKLKKKFDEKYDGNINNLLYRILDFLRLSIILSITIRMDKEEFIDTVDNSLIDTTGNQKLANVLNPAKNILGNNER
jgi:hypothetical protein